MKRRGWAHVGRLGCVTVYLALFAAHALAGWRDDVPAARRIGEGDFSFFGIRLYQAQLWGKGDPTAFDTPFALRIVYAKHIRRERLVETGLSEIERTRATPVPAATLATWRADMMTAFDDVAPGDELCAVYLPGKGVRFYAGERMSGEFDDPAFARAFFGIWLDPRTRAPALRRELLGQDAQ